MGDLYSRFPDPGLKVWTFSPGNLVPVGKTGTKGPSQPGLKPVSLVVQGQRSGGRALHLEGAVAVHSEAAGEQIRAIRRGTSGYE